MERPLASNQNELSGDLQEWYLIADQWSLSLIARSMTLPANSAILFLGTGLHLEFRERHRRPK